ncbi:hypothetical protein HEP85_38860 [Streptomyces sp. RPA4-2]|uniref:hypothetical protein n=1 Tax=Streptomyces sp. RPA4-2 TaxID=2721244 RepID=UPI00143E2303|nr:hypothetical protein [Streptomyces sp. RPA4-2]QIY66406.1 hypothetical protein HEP85_38860 [Streptomyces sp. RPA4-2]
MSVDEAQIKSSVSVGGPAQSIEMDFFESGHLADAFQQRRRPVQVQHVVRRWIPVGIPVR